MLYRRFGRTGLQMPVFSCGGMRYQHKWQDMPLTDIPDENQRNLEATIGRALELGITHIETAHGYGSSERQLGVILSKLPRQQLIIQTKVGPSEKPDDFTRNFEDSLARLQLQYVDLLAIHGINDAQSLDHSIRPGGCLCAARRLQQRGLVRHVGFSTHGPTDIILKAISHEPAGGFDYVNLHWYYIFQRNWPAIEAATARGRDMGVFIISPSDKGGMLYDPPQRLTQLTAPLHPIIFNDLFCLSHPQIHTLSIGAARPTDFDLHIQSLPLLPQASTLLPPILAHLHDAYHSAVEATLRDPFELKVPTWEDTPGNVNIHSIIWLRNLVKAFDLHRFAKSRYGLLGNGGSWFPGQPADKLPDIDPATFCVDPEIAPRLRALLAESHSLLRTEDAKLPG